MKIRETFEKNVQNITDKHINIVDEKVSSKEKEITQYEPIKSCSHYHGW